MNNITQMALAPFWTGALSLLPLAFVPTISSPRMLLLTLFESTSASLTPD